jgi:hypothetical protein
LNLPFIPFKESGYVNPNALSILGLPPLPLPFEERRGEGGRTAPNVKIDFMFVLLPQGAETVKEVKFLFSGL